MTDQIPWCCTGRGYVSECPLCPQYGTSLLDPCPGHEASEANQNRVVEARLHAERRHPGYEYATTTGPRKQWDDADRPPAGENADPDYTWEPNLDAGHPGAGWERFDYHEEAYWRRRKTPPQPADAPRSAAQAADGPAEPRHAHDGAQAAQGGPLHDFDRDPAALTWARGKIQHYIDRLAGFEQQAAGNGDEASVHCFRIVQSHVRSYFLGDGGCVIGVFDQRRPAHLDAIQASSDGPSVAECAKADARWWNAEKEGE